MAYCRPLEAATRTGDSGCDRSGTRRIHFERGDPVAYSLPIACHSFDSQLTGPSGRPLDPLASLGLTWLRPTSLGGAPA